MRKKILIGILLIGCILMKSYITDMDIKNGDKGTTSGTYSLGYAADSCQLCGAPWTVEYGYQSDLYHWAKLGPACGHVNREMSYNNAHSYSGCTCTRCNATIHTYSAFAGCCDVGMKCIRCGLIQAHTCHWHAYSAPTCTTAGVCITFNCGAPGSPALGHNFSVVCCNAGNKCSRCGEKNHSPCVVCTYLTCPKPHCGVTYCVHCTGAHTCNGDHSYITCGVVHCGIYYCTKCGHTCQGGHTYITCTMPHCSAGSYCTKCGHTCGGDHSYAVCASAHCGQSYCTKAPCSHTCGGGHINSNSWTDLGSSHVVRCSVGSCTYNFATHQENSWTLWSNDTPNDRHIRTCSTCDASSYNNKIYQTENHLYSKDYTAFATGHASYLQYHSATCYAINCGKIINQSHVDVNDDYICDSCGAELWRLTYDVPEPTLVGGSSNITATLKVWKEVYCSSPEIKIPSNTFTYVFTENGYFDFIFGTSNKTVRAEVNRINRTVCGRIVYSPIFVTSGAVNATFIPDYEEETYGDILKNGKTISIDGHAVTAGNTYELPDFNKNETRTYTITDNIGNSKTITATVNWIIEGDKAIASSTYQVMNGGYVFTNILVKANQGWSISDLVDRIDIEVKEKSTGTAMQGVNKNVIGVINYYTGDTIIGTDVEKGIYYIKIAIGGAGVFIDGNKVYEVKLNGILDSEGITLFTGRNKIEVETYSAIDLT